MPTKMLRKGSIDVLIQSYGKSLLSMLKTLNTLITMKEVTN